MSVVKITNGVGSAHFISFPPSVPTTAAVEATNRVIRQVKEDHAGRVLVNDIVWLLSSLGANLLYGVATPDATATETL